MTQREFLQKEISEVNSLLMRDIHNDSLREKFDSLVLELDLLPIEPLHPEHDRSRWYRVNIEEFNCVGRKINLFNSHPFRAESIDEACVMLVRICLIDLIQTMTSSMFEEFYYYGMLNARVFIKVLDKPEISFDKPY